MGTDYEAQLVELELLGAIGDLNEGFSFEGGFERGEVNDISGRAW